jgi:uncharacterized protein (TIGR02271 family)
MKTTTSLPSLNLNRLGRKTKLLTSVAAGSCALFLVGCRDRDRDIVQTDTTTTAEQRENYAYNSPATPASPTAASARATARQEAEVKDSAEVVLHEENLNVDKRQVDAGGVLVTKQVVTEEVEQPVELQRERVEVTQLSAEEARERGAAGEASIEEGQIYIPLSREEAIVQKDVTTSGAVRVEKETDTEQRNVSDTVRREVVDVERQGAAREPGQMNESSGFASTNPQRDAQGGDLEQRIRENLRNDTSLALTESQIEDIEISVEQDTVRLSGNVPTQEAAQRIEERVRQIGGVQMVQNELEADPSTQAAE